MFLYLLVNWNSCYCMYLVLYQTHRDENGNFKRRSVNETYISFTVRCYA